MKFGHESSAFARRRPCTAYAIVHVASLQMTPSWVTKTPTSITLDRIEIEPCARWHCACLVMTYRLISNTTYLDHSLSQAIWSEFRSNLPIDLSESKCICFEASRRDNYYDAKIFPTFLRSIVIASTFSNTLQNHTFRLTCPENVKMCPKVVK